jgi:hypothetical protein
MIYAPNFIEELLRPHILLPGRTFGICQSGDLPENLCSEQTGRLTPVNFYALCKLAKYARDPAIGVCQSFSRSWIEKVHGYDERFELDAYEDNDMEKRAVLSNLWFANVASRTTLLHQWHEINKSALFPGGGFEAVRERNKQMWMDGVSVVRNPEGWGILPDGASIIEPEM